MNAKQRIGERSVAKNKSLADGDYERRAYPRYQVHKIVTYTHRGKQFLTVTVDVGMGGMKIKTHYKLPEDEGMNFKMVLGDNSISLEGRVVYSRTLPDKERVSGIQFVGLSRRDSALLCAYLSAVEA